MGLFNSKKINIYAPFDGEVIKIEDVDDQVFKEKTLGDGIALIPKDDVDKVFSPLEGNVVKVFKTKHAVSLESKGLELFIHVGIDTVSLKGEGFESKVEKGSQVSSSDCLLEIDLNLIKEKAKSTSTPIVISNMEKIKNFEKHLGEKKRGEVIATITMK